MSHRPLVSAAACLGLWACVSAPPPAPPPAVTPAPTASTAAASSAPAAPVASASAPPPRRAAPSAPDASPPADLGRAACKQGDARACDALAEYWGAREFLPEKREAEARGDGETLRDACESKKIASACMGYALMLKYGTATGKRDGDAAKPYWARVKELGDLNGFRDGSSEEGKQALRKTQQDCDEGRARACYQLGWAAYNGIQREKSVADAFAASAEACRLGSALGCRWAGHYAFVYPEVGEAKNAKALLERGCKGQNPGACSELGQYVDKHESGATAPALFAQACDAGGRDGCLFAGRKLLETGKKAEGAARLKQGCDAEQEEACDALGPMLEKGENIKKNAEEALTAYQRGCAGKQEASCAALGRLAGSDRADKCVLDPKKPPKIGDRGASALKKYCKENASAPWCKGIKACPLARASGLPITGTRAETEGRAKAKTEARARASTTRQTRASGAMGSGQRTAR